MNKRSKIALFSLLALIAAFGLMFAGCENPVQEVEGTVGLKQNSVPAPVSISVTESSANVVIVYEAVDDAAGHNFYLRIPNSKVAQTMTLYSAISTSISGNTVTVTIAKTSIGIGSAGKYQIGIQTTKLLNSTSMDSPSTVKWTSVTTTS